MLCLLPFERWGVLIVKANWTLTTYVSKQRQVPRIIHFSWEFPWWAYLFVAACFLAHVVLCSIFSKWDKDMQKRDSKEQETVFYGPFIPRPCPWTPEKVLQALGWKIYCLVNLSALVHGQRRHRRLWGQPRVPLRNMRLACEGASSFSLTQILASLTSSEEFCLISELKHAHGHAITGRVWFSFQMVWVSSKFV